MRPASQRILIRLLAVALMFAWIAISPARVFAQTKLPSGKKTTTDPPPSGELAEAARGQIVYKDRCGICHFSESDVKKIGPGLKGIYKRGKFADGHKVDDASVEDRILNGGKDMPPFKQELTPNQLRELIAYLKTLR